MLNPPSILPGQRGTAATRAQGASLLQAVGCQERRQDIDKACESTADQEIGKIAVKFPMLYLWWPRLRR